MPKSIISEGATTNEAIENGLKKLNVSKNMVDIHVVEEEKRSFFSILTPRVVKVELTVKEEKNGKEIKEKKTPIKKEQKEEKIYEKAKERPALNESKEEIEEAMKEIKAFLGEFVLKIPSKEVNYEVTTQDSFIYVELTGKEMNYLIGYRGETLNALQVILTSIANRKASAKIRVLLNIEGYREKRTKSLEELADKISKTVIRTGKTITLEPMTSYERKVIHSKLQENNKVKTYSTGEEPYRKVVIALK